MHAAIAVWMTSDTWDGPVEIDPEQCIVTKIVSVDQIHMYGSVDTCPEIPGP